MPTQWALYLNFRTTLLFEPLSHLTRLGQRHTVDASSLIDLGTGGLRPGF
ncbi:MAG: hypothetical protein F6K30_10880 [Cyanothece sp. SIO2G6]|nr:hypothetical protein [Cyanothece sp. SIO2G6]